jgi:FMN phosphatase YigB (HAD superfamily)
MTQTLLIDLDNTLLSNGVDTFLPAYLQALSKHLAPFADGKHLVQTLLKATSQMVANDRPDCTLKEIFGNHFYPGLGLKESDLTSAIDTFYKEVFPDLRRLTQPRPGAVQLVEEALRRGFRIAIATNPLFPRTAILQRLEWAGLPTGEYPFDLISSYESFHYAKPSPAYLAECLARLGWPEGPVVLLGDSLENDIAPALALGLAVYQVIPDGDLSGGNPESAAPAGSLDGFFPWLDSADPAALEPEFNQPNALLAVLRSTPAVLDHLTRPLPLEPWTHRPAPEEWSLTEILSHLRDVDEEVNLPRLQKVLNENNPFLPGMVTDPWAEERQYNRQNGPAALWRFTAVRLKLLDLLQGLLPEKWQRTARHAIFGPTSLRELVSIQASHDRLHLQQVFHVVQGVFSEN